MSYDLSDDLMVGGGLCYLKDKKEVDVLFLMFVICKYVSVDFDVVIWDLNVLY